MSQSDLAKLFRDMADKIEATEETEFGGAFVVVPPATETPICALVTASEMGADLFFLLLATQVKMLQDRVDSKRMGGMGRR